MSDVKKPASKPSTDASKKDLPKVDETPKDKKAGAGDKNPESKKDLPKVDEGSKNKAGSKKDLDESKKATDPGKVQKDDGSKKPTGDGSKPSETKDQSPDSKQKVLQPEIQNLIKSIIQEYGQVANLFNKSLEKTISALTGTPEQIQKLENINMYYRSLDSVCRAAQKCVHESFNSVTSTFKDLEKQLSKPLELKEGSITQAQETEELSKLITKIDLEIKGIFEDKRNEEIAEGKKGYETITVKGLDNDAEQRLHSANYSKKSPTKNKDGDHEGAAERSKVKREVTKGLFDKTFVGYKNLAVSMAMKRAHSSDKTALFKEYQKLFELKSSPDIILKGMGSLL